MYLDGINGEWRVRNGVLFDAKLFRVLLHTLKPSPKEKIPLIKYPNVTLSVVTFNNVYIANSSMFHSFSAPTMIRQVPRCLLRAPPLPLRAAPTRRFLSTAPPAQKSRSWRNYTTRLALAAGVVYYYNTSTLFAEEPPCSSPPPHL